VIPKLGAEYVARKLPSQETFAQARKEFERATWNYASIRPPDDIGRFTVRRPDEYPLLEIWHLGLGPNISGGYCVAPRPRAWWNDNSEAAEEQPLLVRHGAPPSTVISEGSISDTAFEALLEPLKHVQVPPYPGEEAILSTVRSSASKFYWDPLASLTNGTHQWHSIPPKGWEPIPQRLYGAVCQLRSFTDTPIS
jgi:hypothetical protein